MAFLTFICFACKKRYKGKGKQTRPWSRVILSYKISNGLLHLSLNLLQLANKSFCNHQHSLLAFWKYQVFRWFCYVSTLQKKDYRIKYITQEAEIFSFLQNIWTNSNYHILTICGLRNENLMCQSSYSTVFHQCYTYYVYIENLHLTHIRH